MDLQLSRLSKLAIIELLEPAQCTDYRTMDRKSQSTMASHMRSAQAIMMEH